MTASAVGRNRGVAGAVEDRLGDPAVYGDEKRAALPGAAGRKGLLGVPLDWGGPGYEGKVEGDFTQSRLQRRRLQLATNVEWWTSANWLAWPANRRPAQSAAAGWADNHLDLAGKESAAGSHDPQLRGAVVIVSHDRYLLDVVVDEVVEVGGWPVDELQRQLLRIRLRETDPS